MNKASLITTGVTRTLIVLFWLLLVYGLLLLPYFSNLFEPERSICIYMWADKIDEEVLQDFEKETGIRVYTNYYDSNEELITKLEVMPFVDCDVILPSGYIVEDLVQAGLLKEIDHARCNFINDLYPELMGKFYDRENRYSLPLYWDVMVLGYSKREFPDGLPGQSWSMVFDERFVPVKRIGMIDDAREVISLIGKYLDLKKEDINKHTIKNMRDLLINQKKWAGVYCDAQQGYFLLSGAYPLVVSQREYVAREMEENPHIDYMIPREGSLLTIDNVVISAATEKEDLVYQFLNFLYSHDVYLHNSKEFAILPASRSVFKDLDPVYIGDANLNPKVLRKKNIRVFKNLLSLKETNEFWIRVKSA